MKKTIAVIGDCKIDRNGAKYELAFGMGKALVDNGYRVQSGGLGGVMEAAFAGARASDRYTEGDTVAIVPSFDRTAVNAFADIVIPTGLDIMRNTIVANADAVIAIGGGAGTLSEMATAWSLYRLIVAFSNADGWSAELADRKIDRRDRYPGIDDKVFGVTTPEQAIERLNAYIDVYGKQHHGIRWRG